MAIKGQSGTDKTAVTVNWEPGTDFKGEPMTDFVNRTIDNLRAGRLGPVVRWVEAHPRLASWIFLATGMVIMIVLAAKDVGLLPGQWAALIITTILVAGLCVWIVSWEDEDEEQPVAAAKAQPTGKAVKAEAAKGGKAETTRAAGKKPSGKKTTTSGGG